MPAPIPQKQVIDKEQARMLVADIGYTEASKQTGIKRDTLYKWGQRKGWKEPVSHAQQLTVQSVQSSPADAHAALLREHDKETRMSLARASRRMSKDCEELPVRHAKLAHTVAQTAAIVHNWSGTERNPGIVNLNVLANKAAVQVVQGEPDMSG